MCVRACACVCDPLSLHGRKAPSAAFEHAFVLTLLLTRLGTQARGRGTLHFRYCQYILELLMIYGRSRGQCLARASGAYRCMVPAYLSVFHPQVLFVLHSL